MLRENLNDFLEKIEWKEVKKEYLTLDEVKTGRYTLQNSSLKTSLPVCLHDRPMYQ